MKDYTNSSRNTDFRTLSGQGQTNAHVPPNRFDELDALGREPPRNWNNWRNLSHLQGLSQNAGDSPEVKGVRLRTELYTDAAKISAEIAAHTAATVLPFVAGPRAAVAGAEILEAVSVGRGITNVVPESFQFARVLNPAQAAELRAGGNPLLSSFAGAEDTFITASEALPSGLTRGEVAHLLTIPEANVGAVIRFGVPGGEGLASPVFRNIPGFVGGGRTAGGLPEFVIPN